LAEQIGVGRINWLSRKTGKNLGKPAKTVPESRNRL
jgi:hypothetical protein